MSWIKPRKIWVFLDLEGPQVINNNAYEITVALAKERGLGEEVGNKFYQALSRIDDIWGDFHLISKDPNYSSGHTLKVVLPFFKAMGANSLWLQEFSRESIRVVPYIKEVLADLCGSYNIWIISTSYEWFVRAYCREIGFNLSRTNFTRVKWFDRTPISQKETTQLLTFMEQIVGKPIIGYDKKTGKIIPEHQAVYDEFTNFIWNQVYNMPVGRLLRTVQPVGQAQKREAMEAVCQKFGVPKNRVMYVGDSQTDVQVVKWLKGEGLSMMFNGKGLVFALSDIAYIGEDARAIEWVADTFAKLGRQGALDWYTIPRGVTGRSLTTITPENIEALEARSVEERKKLLGVPIGELS